MSKQSGRGAQDMEIDQMIGKSPSTHVIFAKGVSLIVPPTFLCIGQNGEPSAFFEDEREEQERFGPWPAVVISGGGALSDTARRWTHQFGATHA